MTGQLNVGVAEGCTPRLLRELNDTESLDAYRGTGGYAALPDPETFVTTVTDGGLLGRGGAAFPLGRKLSTVRNAGVRPVVLANGEEGEPASVKDRWLLRYRPHLVLDGLRLAAHTVGAGRAVLYVSDPAGARAVAAAIADFDGVLGGAALELVTVEPGYVAGEETAAVRAVNGGPAKPTDKPPRPFQEGVDGRPTLVSNVETLAHLPFLLAHGAAEYRSVGTPGSPGTFLSTVTGAGAPVTYELAHGTPVPELLARHGVSTDRVTGLLLGGYFNGLINRRVLDASMDHETLRGLGAGLGCGAIAVLTEETCPVAVAAAVLRYFDRENAGQCGSCFNGTAAMAAAAEALRDGLATGEDLDRLRRWSTVLRGRGACGTLDAATNVAASLFAEFPDEVSAHLGGRCPTCAAHPYTAVRPFEVEAGELV
ncbi:NADH-quinone oxidoreductase subunit F [Nocardia sp. RB56]|uniref:NADH-quinone oxidoreductase subunit F n=2 Tax=Nocardia aurantia TaxID=2585199 RepID=A0A7K0DTH8_9NOCA|nr:NADH-ubiquinone oxidoreductase-F iron-sulfur binding region domain-containing protein [Nocardia aurantia]MQY28837.1 NADH-quinone oxidoreductase subunit F [Nocardia aurantia]